LGRPPSLREIGEKFGINSTNGVRTALEALSGRDIFAATATCRAASKFSKKRRNISTREDFDGALIGRVAAGTPLWAEQNIEGNFCIDRSFVTGDQIFALRVKGDSMMNAGILDGDFVLVRRQETADRGEIVVCANRG
jgi:repressor LexA